jgi:hypothetical protein
MRGIKSAGPSTWRWTHHPRGEVFSTQVSTFVPCSVVGSGPDLRPRTCCRRDCAQCACRGDEGLDVRDHPGHVERRGGEPAERVEVGGPRSSSRAPWGSPLMGVVRCRVVFDSQGGYKWSITFNSTMGNVPQMTPYSALTPATQVNVATGTSQVRPPPPSSCDPTRLMVLSSCRRGMSSGALSAFPSGARLRQVWPTTPRRTRSRRRSRT